MLSVFIFPRDEGHEKSDAKSAGGDTFPDKGRLEDFL